MCQDRQDLIDHGFDPVSFAYPTGAYDTTGRERSCRAAATPALGLPVVSTSPATVRAPSTPRRCRPTTATRLRTLYDPPTGTPANVPPLTLSHLQAAVNAAAQHGGGWVPLVFHDVCSQTLDPDNYSFCINDWGPIELTTLNTFLDWLQNAGQPGGAPARTVVETVSQVMNGPDTPAPVTHADLQRRPRAVRRRTPARSRLDFKATDPGGSGVAATYYTTDGSTPTTSSPTGQPRRSRSTATTTFKFFSVDNAGNVEPVQTLQVQVAPEHRSGRRRRR